MLLFVVKIGRRSSTLLFKRLLPEYNLPVDLSFSIDLPDKVQAILSDQILTTEFGITLKSFNRLYKATESWNNQSFIEDNENHFHVGWYVEPIHQKGFYACC